MKKTYLAAVILLSLSACTKENFVHEDSSIDPSKIVFNIDVKNADTPETKGVKTSWENGDSIYLLFEDNDKQYVQMTYNGSSWVYTDKEGGTTYTDLILSSSGKHLSAMYAPSYYYGDLENYYFPCFHPFYSDSSWQTDATVFFQTASNVPYTVVSDGDNPASLNATISLSFPVDDVNYLMQFFVPESEAPEDTYSYWLLVSDVKPFTWDGFNEDGTARNISVGIAGSPIYGYHCMINGQSGYYFWGILDGHGDHDFNFQLVHAMEHYSRYFALSSKSKDVGTKTITGPAAIKLASFTDNGKFVDLGYGGPLWATGNLKDEGDHIADPFAAGDFYMWGDGIAYNPTNYSTVNHSSSSTTDIQGTAEDDTARKVSGHNDWMMPTKAQFEALMTNTTHTWAQFSLGGGGGYILTSNLNGFSIYLPFDGYYRNGVRLGTKDAGNYWTSTPKTDVVNGAYSYFLDWDDILCSDTNSDAGLSIRPIKN